MSVHYLESRKLVMVLHGPYRGCFGTVVNQNGDGKSVAVILRVNWQLTPPVYVDSQAIRPVSSGVWIFPWPFKLTFVAMIAAWLIWGIERGPYSLAAALTITVIAWISPLIWLRRKVAADSVCPKCENALDGTTLSRCESCGWTRPMPDSPAPTPNLSKP